jgi:hypothetical protein
MYMKCINGFKKCVPHQVEYIDVFTIYVAHIHEIHPCIQKICITGDHEIHQCIHMRYINVFINLSQMYMKYINVFLNLSQMYMKYIVFINLSQMYMKYINVFINLSQMYKCT